MAGKLFKTDKNGTKYYIDYTCRRCGGKGGADAWSYTGYTCYRCGGSGVDPTGDIYKVYTPEYQAKLDAMAKVRAEKKRVKAEAEFESKKPEFMAKEGFCKDGEDYVTYRAVGNTYEIKDELKSLGFKFNYDLGWHIGQPVEGIKTQCLKFDDVADKMDIRGCIWWKDNVRSLWAEEIEKALKKAELEANATQLFEVGDKVEIEADVTNVFTGKSSYSYYGQVYIYKMISDGNIYIWKTSNFFANGRYKVNATVKALSERDGIKQTELTRCKLSLLEV